MSMSTSFLEILEQREKELASKEEVKPVSETVSENVSDNTDKNANERYNKLNEYQKNDLLLSTIAKENVQYIPVYKPLIQALGFEDACFASFLINRYNLHVKENKVMDGGWFFLTSKKINEETRLGEKAQNTRIKSLVAKGVIETANKGIGNKRHIRLNSVALVKILTDSEHTTTLRVIQSKKDKEKAAHLPPGPKAKKSVDNVCINPVDNVENSNVKFLQHGEVESLQQGESTSSNMEKQLPPTGRNILYSINNPSPISIYPEKIDNPSNPSTNSSKGDEAEMVTKDDVQNRFQRDFAIKQAIEEQQKAENAKILYGVRMLVDKFPTFPKELVDFLTSKVSRAYESNRKIYDGFNQYYFVFANLYEQYKDQMTIEGFISVFNDYFLHKGSKIYTVKSFIETRIKLRLGLIESKFETNMVRKQYMLKTFTEAEKQHYKKLHSTFDSMFPWHYYNEIMGSSLTAQEIEAAKEKWVAFKTQLLGATN